MIVRLVWYLGERLRNCFSGGCLFGRLILCEVLEFKRDVI